MRQKPDEYFRIERPEAPTLPVVVDVPHAGEWIPEAVASEMVVGDQLLRRDLDLYVDQLWARAPELGATLIASHVSRYVIDLNRAADDVSPHTVRGARRIDRPGYYQDRGVVWRTTTDGTPVMADPMPERAFTRRISTFHTPYHEALRAEIERVRDRFGYCLLLDGHSMPSQGRSGHTDTGSRRADIVPGDVDGASCSPLLTNLVCEHFRARGYSVRPNTPYKGGWITRSFGEPARGVHALQIEVNRALYMDEATFEPRPEGMRALAEACAALLPRLQGLLG